MNAPLIASIRVANLFGLYTYTLPQAGVLPDAAILYGDNGMGKSTLLRLAFHLLSSAGRRGHRSALLDAPFDELEVHLGTGVTLLAKRVSEPTPTLQLTISNGTGVLASWDHRPRGVASEEIHFDDDTVQALTGATWEAARKVLLNLSHARPQRDQNAAATHGEKPYIAALEKAAPIVFLLDAERRLDSDAVADPDDEVEFRRQMRYSEPKRIHDLVRRAREIALSQALAAAARWMNKQVLEGANQGSTNVHSVYVELLKHLVSAQPSASDTQIDTSDLAERLREIEHRATEYAQYEFTTSLPMVEFNAALASPSSGLVRELIEPYVRSLESRLDALKPAYSILHRFVETINIAFLRDKKLSFQPSIGFSIHSKNGLQLQPAQLSSGEQQLLLLMCYVLIGRDTPSVFMIDEPEISLNVKWQRQLVQSLLELTTGTNTQFIFASHSMELIAQHRNRVVQLAESKHG